MLDHVAPVNKQVKGVLKGLRYISQIFDGEKEQEMVIGLPTDVKHVAHIGWDGPTCLNGPNWMNELHSAPLSTSFDPDGKQPGSSKCASQEIPLGGGGLPPPSPSRDDISFSSSSPKPPCTRPQASSESPGSHSPSREHSSRGTRHSRKNLSTGSAPGSDNPTREGSESTSSLRGRHLHKSDNAIGSGSSPARDLPSIPKQSRKKNKDKDKEGKEKGEGKKEEKKKGKKERKSKESSSDDGSTRSRSKNPPSSRGLPGSEETIARAVTVEDEAV